MSWLTAWAFRSRPDGTTDVPGCATGGAGEVLAVSTGGEREVIARLAPQTIPLSIDWLPDGRMLIVDGPRGRLLRREPDGTLDTVADLTGLGRPPFNELVVDATGNAYVNGGPGIVCVHPDGSMREVAGGLQWPNGMALIDDGRTLVVADSRDGPDWTGQLLAAPGQPAPHAGHPWR
jgi:hypothetical protein